MLQVYKKKSPHRQKGGKDEVLDVNSARHGLVGWVEEDGARVPYIFHQPTGEFVPLARFIQLKSERAEQNRRNYVHRPIERRDRWSLRPYMWG